MSWRIALPCSVWLDLRGLSEVRFCATVSLCGFVWVQCLGPSHCATVCLSTFKVESCPNLPLPLLLASMAQIGGSPWCVTFEDVADPMAMKLKLENCVFFRNKCTAASVEIVGPNIVFHFVAVIERQGIQQKCAQTFKAYGKFTSFRIAAKTGPQPELETLQFAENNYGKHFRKFPEIYGWSVCWPWLSIRP